MPVYFRGHNGPLFQMAGFVHPRLRTVLLPRELLNKRGTRIDVRVGALISPRKFASFADRRDLVAYLRGRTLMLGERRDASHREPAPSRGGPWPFRQPMPEPIAACVDPDLMRSEIDRLPGDQTLVRDGRRLAVWARAAQIPVTLREIARLRELTFRAADEGTGKSIDLDAFDETYLHLFVYDRHDQAIVGAYRLGPTDELLARGPAGLYTSTLFDLKPELFRTMGPALEMGRSFVCERYQKKRHS